jgi:hypothetical protein
MMQARPHDPTIQATEVKSFAARSADVSRVRLGAASLAVAGLLFVLYPAIRPFSDETSLQGARAFASNAWLVAHMLAMVGFTLVMLGLLSLHTALQETAAERPAFRALVASMLGVGLTLPFYGGEAFGLHAIGQQALQEHSAALVRLASVVRSGPELYMFVVGLVLLGVGAILAAAAIWKSGVLARWSGVPFALGFGLYIPQFFGTQPIRVAHGVLVAIGCLWTAAGMWRQGSGRAIR